MLKGLGVEKDLRQAFRWWTIAADGGNAVAKRNLEFLCRENPEACKPPVANRLISLLAPLLGKGD